MIGAPTLRAGLAALALTLPAAAGAAQHEPESSEYRTVSELAADGFTPFGASQSGNASFGMANGSEIYMCFLADKTEYQAERQKVLLDAIEGEAETRMVPNIPVFCVLTQ